MPKITLRLTPEEAYYLRHQLEVYDTRGSGPEISKVLDNLHGRLDRLINSQQHVMYRINERQGDKKEHTHEI